MKNMENIVLGQGSLSSPECHLQRAEVSSVSDSETLFTIALFIGHSGLDKGPWLRTQIQNGNYISH